MMKPFIGVLVLSVVMQHTIAAVLMPRKTKSWCKTDVLDPNQRSLSGTKTFSGALSPSAVTAVYRQKLERLKHQRGTE